VCLASVLWWEACAVPAWVTTAEQDAEVAVPIAASLVDVVDPAVAPVVTLIEDGFNALVKTLDTYKALPTATNLQAVQSAFAAVDQNVNQLESAAQIKNTTTASTVTNVVALLTQAVTEIAAVVPESASSTADIKSLVAARHTVKHWKARDFQRGYNKLAKADPRLRKICWKCEVPKNRN